MGACRVDEDIMSVTLSVTISWAVTCRVDEDIVKPEVEAVGERPVEPAALGTLRLARCVRPALEGVFYPVATKQRHEVRALFLQQPLYLRGCQLLSVTLSDDARPLLV